MATTNRIGKTATTIRTERGDTIIRYHQTDIVRFNATHITLNTGGWHTATTALRMNQTARQFGLSYGVYRRGGKRAGSTRNNIVYCVPKPNGAEIWVSMPNGCQTALGDYPVTFERSNPLPDSAVEAMAQTDTDTGGKYTKFTRLID